MRFLEEARAEVGFVSEDAGLEKCTVSWRDGVSWVSDGEMRAGSDVVADEEVGPGRLGKPGWSSFL